jgi:tripartite-type tricarboxylate transporter receptor subunit TctC
VPVAHSRSHRGGLRPRVAARCARDYRAIATSATVSPAFLNRPVGAELTAAAPPENLAAPGGRGDRAGEGSGTVSMVIAYRLQRVVVAAACFLGATCLSGAISVAAAQDTVEPFFKGKQIAMIVGSSPGGGYDTYARLLARPFGNAIPGKPAVVVQNMSGAGSNRAAGYVYSVAPKDGTTIAAIFPGAVILPLLGDVKVQHDPSKLIYLGSANSDVYVCYVRTDAPVKTYKDMLTKELIVGASNPGATTYDLPLLLNNVVGTKFRIVTGYPGSREIAIALERGEVQGACGIGWTGIEALHPDWFRDDKIRVLVQLSNKGHADLNKRHVPLAAELARNDDERRVIELVFSQGLFGRPYVLPPGVPADRVAALRKAFVEALNDKDLRSDADKMHLDIDPIAGDELQKIVSNLYATPKPIVERARQALSARPKQ